MPPIRFARAALLGLAAMLSAVLVAPTAGHAQEDPVEVPVVAAPALPSWDETSGYGAVETTRAAISALPDASTVISSLVPSDVRWAPERSSTQAPSVASIRLAAAQQALLSGDLGSLQEDALMAMVAAGTSWDETSGYGAVEASRAALSSPNDPTGADAAAMLAQFRAVELALSSSLGAEADAAPLERGTRAESATVWTILQNDAVPANSDDRIANALFGPR